MSQEAVPDQAVPEQRGGAPKGLLQQMEELMAALNADLSQLDADLQSSADRAPADRSAPDSPESTPGTSTGPSFGTSTGTAADTTASASAPADRPADRMGGEPGR